MIMWSFLHKSYLSLSYKPFIISMYKIRVKHSVNSHLANIF